MTKLLRLAFIAGLSGAGAAAASPAGDIGGTWECRQPGIQYANKPPIVYFADSGGAQGTVDVDGFAREVFGRTEFAPDEGGWWRVRPAQGPEFMIRPDPAAKGTPAMALRRAVGTADYQCLRLPPTGTPALEPSGLKSVLPESAQDAPVPATPETAPSVAPGQEPGRQ